MPHHHFAPAAVRVAAATLLAAALSGCQLINFLVSDMQQPAAGPSATPAQPVAPRATMPPARDVDPASVRAVRQAEGWRWVELPSAGFRMLLPPDWFVATPHDGDRLGEFADLPPFLQESSIVAALEGDDGDQIALYARHPEYARGDEPALALIVTTWRDVGTPASLQDLAGILFATRGVGPGAPPVSVATGLGEAWRFQWWAALPTGGPITMLEAVVRAPTGDPYTVSLLVEEAYTDAWLPAFGDMLLAIEPLG
jgi:hypothetical protein